VKASRWQVVVLVIALCFLAGVVGWMIGRPSEAKFDDVDVGFLSDMQTHHGGAIALGFAYLRNEDDSLVGHYAREIVLDQAQEISTMNSYLGQAGAVDDRSVNDDVAMDWMGLAVPKAEMPGMASEAEMAALRAATGRDADDQFTKLMIRHHAAGVAMADYAVEHGENDSVKRLAASMARLQRAEIAEMNSRRKSLGLDPIDASELEQLHGEHSD
jgi:uncharacterized protein (DUF305 family)